MSRLAIWLAGVATSSLLPNAHEESENKTEAKQLKDSREQRNESLDHTHSSIQQFDVTTHQATHHVALTLGIFLCVLLHARLPLISGSSRVDAAGEDRDAKTRHDVSPTCLCHGLAQPRVGDQIHTQEPGGHASHTTTLPCTPLSLLLDFSGVRTHGPNGPTTTKLFYETAMYIPRRVTSRAYRHSHTPTHPHTHANSHRGTGGQRTQHVGLTSHPTGRRLHVRHTQPFRPPGLHHSIQSYNDDRQRQQQHG